MEPPFSYDAIADAYSAAVDAAPYNALYERPAMLSLLPAVQGARVLDAGCGSGWYAERLIGLGARVTAVDASAGMVRHARARLCPLATPAGAGLAELIVADLAAPLPFADASFDGIVSPLVLHYLSEWGPTLAEFRRVLAPHGWLLFSTHHPAAEAAKLGAADYFAVERVEEDWGVGTVRFYRRPLRAIADALAHAGFLIERIVEPAPGEEFRAADPVRYARLMAQPEFILFRARAPG